MATNCNGGCIEIGAVLLILASCVPDDVGETCPIEGLGSGEDPNSPDFPEVIEINTTFPCEALVCLVTDANGGYCSRECSTDAGCPSAFECRQVGEIGPLSEREFCAWRPCQVDFQCGDPRVYTCKLSTDGLVGRCARGS